MGEVTSFRSLSTHPILVLLTRHGDGRLVRESLQPMRMCRIRTALWNDANRKDGDNSSELLEEQKRKSASVGGMNTGIVLLLVSIVVNLWFFTIPPEFRRTRICSEQESAEYPDICMTERQFASRIAEYYKGGGGVQWDFTVAPETKEFYNR